MKFIYSLLIALGLAAGGFFPGYYYYQAQANNRTVTVKGLAEMEVKADLAVWKIKFKTTGNDLAVCQQKMATDANAVNDYLVSQGFNAAEISSGRMNTNDLMANQYRDARASDSRYILDQTITVRSADVEKVEASLRKIGSLVSKGVIFEYQDYSSPVTYLFTGLNQIKPQMLEQATKNAYASALEFAKSSQSKVGKIKTANHGIFSILPCEQIDAVMESAQIDKTVRVVSTIVYYLE